LFYCDGAGYSWQTGNVAAGVDIWRVGGNPAEQLDGAAGDTVNDHIAGQQSEFAEVKFRS
jgi:hypothetical protein